MYELKASNLAKAAFGFGISNIRDVLRLQATGVEWKKKKIVRKFP